MLERENARLHAFTNRLANRLFLAAEVLANRAEKRMKRSAWITDWAYIVGEEMYVVCSINQRADKTFYLATPQLMIGWQVSRLMAKCYAALPMPEFKGL